MTTDANNNKENAPRKDQEPLNKKNTQNLAKPARAPSRDRLAPLALPKPFQI